MIIKYLKCAIFGIHLAPPNITKAGSTFLTLHDIDQETADRISHFQAFADDSRHFCSGISGIFRWIGRVNYNKKVFLVQIVDLVSIIFHSIVRKKRLDHLAA